MYQNAATNAGQEAAGDGRKIIHGSPFDLWCLDAANSFAGHFSGCTKVSVGSVIVGLIIFLPKIMNLFM